MLEDVTVGGQGLKSTTGIDIRADFFTYRFVNVGFVNLFKGKMIVLAVFGAERHREHEVKTLVNTRTHHFVGRKGV